MNTTDTEGQTSVERSLSPQTPLPGDLTQAHLESNCLSVALTQLRGTMKIIAVIQARRGGVIRKILRHCAMWHDPPPRGSPRRTRPSRGVRPTPHADGGTTCEVDPDFLENVRREAYRQPELPWKA